MTFPSTTFISRVTTIARAWLQAVNDLLAGLSSTTDPTKGAGSVGFNVAQEYGAGTVGQRLRALSLAAGSSLVGFTQAGVGAVLRTLQDKARDTVSVKDFGALGDGTADDTAAMQAAHDTGRVVYYPEGQYQFTALAIAEGGIVGAGPTSSVLNCTSAANSAAIRYTGVYTDLGSGVASNVPLFRNFSLNGNLLKTTAAGVGLLASPLGAGDISYVHVENVEFNAFPVNLEFTASSFFKIAGSVFRTHTIAGVKVANNDDNDAGDSVIVGNVFNTPFNTATQILQLSSGGLKITGNKLLGGGYGYRLEYTGTKSTSNLLLTCNSIENFVTNAISLTKVSPGIDFKNVVIAGNQIAVSLASPNAFLIATDSGAWLQSVTITGNTLQLPGVTDSYGLALSGVTGLLIAGNIFRGNGGASQAIGLTSCVDAKIGQNVYSNITAPYVLTTPGANNVADLSAQSGAATTASSGWSSYGALYTSPTVTVTFPRAFLSTPTASDVTLTAGAGSGEVGGIVVAVSATQLQLKAIGANTNFAASILWQVRGVL